MAMTPLKAIRAKCIDCCCGQRREVTLCPCETCPLYGFRAGHRPRRVNIPSMSVRREKPRKNGRFIPLAERIHKDDA
jgi:hypothetical protein